MNFSEEQRQCVDEVVARHLIKAGQSCIVSLERAVDILKDMSARNGIDVCIGCFVKYLVDMHSIGLERDANGALEYRGIITCDDVYSSVAGESVDVTAPPQ